MCYLSISQVDTLISRARVFEVRSVGVRYRCVKPEVGISEDQSLDVRLFTFLSEMICLTVPWL
jgi:hypothetical protein